MLIEEILNIMTPELYQRFRRAIELGKWPDGRPVSREQLATCMQSVIAYEARHVQPHERTGYVPPKVTACEGNAVVDSGADAIEPLNWQQ